MAKLFISLSIFVALVGAVSCQDGQNGLSGLLGGILGGGHQQQMPFNGQMPGQLGSMMNGMMNGQQMQQQQPGNLQDMLRNLPQRLQELLRNTLSGVTRMIPGAQQQQFGRNPMQMMGMQQQQQGLLGGLPNQLGLGGQQGLLGQLGQGGNPLGQLTSNLNLNGLTSPLQQNGSPLNGLTQGLQRTVSDVGQQLSRTLSNVVPGSNNAAARPASPATSN